MQQNCALSPPPCRAGRRGLLAAAALCSLAIPALAAAPANLGAAFDNTIVSTYANGAQARLWLDPDGDYRGEGPRGDPSSGHWSIKGAKLCLRQSRPVPVPLSYCTPVVSGGVGTAWTARSVFGEPLSLQLVAGR